MNTKFNKYNQPEKPNIYLGTPNNKKICALTGIDESTFKMTEKLSNTYELSFDISRTLNYTSPITNETVEKENRAFRLISLFMRLYVDGYGWFIIDPPEEDNDSYIDKYSITAQSAEIEFQQHNLHNFKVNQGTTDSYEMLVDGNVQMVGDVEFAKEQIKFYNASNPQLSFLDICLKVAGVTGWTVGYVDTVPKSYEYFDEGVRKEKQTLLADEIGVFDVNSQDLYSFLTQDAAKFFKCIFEFDFDKMQINAYHPENYGKDTNVNISFRNFQKSNSIKPDDTNIFTRYCVQGSDGLGIEYVNFGHNYIENLENYLNERYLSSEVIAKYKLWSQDVEKLSLYLNDRGSDNVIITLNKYAQAIRRMPNYAQYMSDSMKDEFNRYGLVKTYDSIGIAGISGAKKTGTGSLLIPDKRIYGIADKVGTLDMKGEIHTYQDMNNQGEKVHLMLKDFTYGFMLTNIENFAKVTLQ